MRGAGTVLFVLRLERGGTFFKHLQLGAKGAAMASDAFSFYVMPFFLKSTAKLFRYTNGGTLAHNE